MTVSANQESSFSAASQRCPPVESTSSKTAVFKRLRCCRTSRMRGFNVLSCPNQNDPGRESKPVDYDLFLANGTQ
jgi:hypothetical protein